MINSFIKLNKQYKLLLFLFLIFGYQYNYAQIYLHDFGTTTINSHPYTDAPTIFNTNLSNSSWSNTTGAWSNGTGNIGNAIRLSSTASPTETITLTFNVAANYQVAVTSFDFWRQRSNAGAQNWAMKINGIDVGNGTVPTAGATIGANVTNPVAGLTGTVTVQIILSGATGTGTFRLDDFTLNGSVTTTCVQPTIVSFFPTNGPRNTVVEITGSGFQAGTGTSSVKFNGFEATSFNVISNTLLEAVVPTNATTGNISITTNNCTGLSTSQFTIINSSYNIIYSSDIYISEVYDAQVGDGGIFEIYNGTNTAKDLSNYTLERYVDIGGALNYTIPLSGILQPGQFYLIGIGSVPCGITPDLAYGTGFNANDEFKLYNNGVLIDNVQAPNEVGYTIIRSLTAIAPKPVFDPADWTITSTESCADIGSHAPTTTIPIASVNPLKRIICENESTTFTTTLDAGLTYTYQWKVLTAANTWVNVVNNANYSGATSYILSINNAPASFNKNQYYCEVNSTSFKIISNAVQLLVSPIPAAPILADTQPTCATATGSITVTTPALGTGFTYSIDGTNFQVSNEFLALAPNTYNISVKNAAGCISTTSQKIINNAPSSPAAPILADTQPTCSTATGSITVTTPALGTGFTYSIDGTNFQVSNEFLALSPNTYNISVKNAAGCISTTSQKIINNAPSSPAAPILADTQPTCATATGSITVTTPALGTGFTYSIDGTNFQVSNDFLTLAPNTYNISVKNAAGCISTTSQKIINNAPSSPAAPILADTQPTCATATGSITVTTPALGTGFTYSIDGTIFQVSNEFLTLAPNTYNISVKNAAGCISTTSQKIINNAPSSPAAPILADTQPTCATATGSITVTTPALGTGFTYSIDGANFQVSNEFLALAPNTYNISVKNAAGCISTTSQKIINNAPSSPAAPILADTQPTCATATGSITVTTPALGTGFTYSIDGANFQVSNEFLALAPNTYNISVKNAAGCISTTSQKIINNAVGTPNAPTLELTQPTCTTSTGIVKVKNPDLGTGFTYSIDGTNFQVSNEFLALTPNTYNVSVKDGGGCISPITLAIIFNAPTFPKEPKITITQPTCGNPLGQIKINPPVDPSYTYSIDNINYQSSPIFDNLNQGSYDVTAKNYYGCTSTIKLAIINIAPTVPIAPTLISTDPTCLILKGSIEVTAPLGIGFSYSIDGINFQNGTVFNNVEADDYNIFVKNLDGCISNPTPINIKMVPQPISTRESYYYCVDKNNLTLSPAKIDTGLSPSDYSFSWTLHGSLISNTAGKIEADQEGIYRVVATNFITGCEVHLTADVKKSSPATATATVGIDFDYVQTITVNITSGISEYLYQLNEGPFQESNVFNISLGGTYTITVKDKNGCNDFVFTVDAYNFPRFFTPNGDGYNDFWNITEIPNPAQSTVLIFDRMGKLLKQISPTGGGWDGTFVNKAMPATDYWFVLKYEDVNGSQKELKSHFALKR